MKKIFIIHFNALELYPPVQNVLRNIAVQECGNKIYVVTTSVTKKGLKEFDSPASSIRIIHLGKSDPGMQALNRYWNFIIFYLGSLYYLLIKSPSRILYYETLSSFPAWLYKKIFKRDVKIFIHYHEYTSSEEYKQGTKLLRFFHRCEKGLYPVAKWVSHTNVYRMEKFENDIKPVVITEKRILPNYPPVAWYASPAETIQIPVKIVYVGALSMQTMFTKEFANWVADQRGKVSWDIYSYNVDADVHLFFEQLQCSFIHIRGAVDYDNLPMLLKQYHVGIVLYTGHIDNYVYNAPNKLFEYLACGLDVWFPLVMKGSLPYVTERQYPKVIALDFTDLAHFNLEMAIDRKEYLLRHDSFFCEDALKELDKQLFNLEQ